MNVDVSSAAAMNREVVGIVGDVKLRRIGGDTPAVVYVPHAQEYPSLTMTLVARSDGSPALLAPISAGRLPPSIATLRRAKC